MPGPVKRRDEQLFCRHPELIVNAEDTFGQRTLTGVAGRWLARLASPTHRQAVEHRCDRPCLRHAAAWKSRAIG